MSLDRVRKEDMNELVGYIVRGPLPLVPVQCPRDILCIYIYIYTYIHTYICIYIYNMTFSVRGPSLPLVPVQCPDIFYLSYILHFIYIYM